jgi:hypothetical protein
MLYLRARSFSHQLQLLVKFRVEEVYLFYMLLTTNITRWNFNRVYASDDYITIHLLCIIHHLLLYFMSKMWSSTQHEIISHKVTVFTCLGWAGKYKLFLKFNKTGKEHSMLKCVSYSICCAFRISGIMPALQSKWLFSQESDGDWW